MPESESSGMGVVYVAMGLVATAVVIGGLYLLLDNGEPAPQVAAAPAGVDSDATKVSEMSVDAPTEERPAEPEEEINLERANKMTGRDWVKLDEKGREATVKLLAMILSITDKNVRVEKGALSIYEFYDAFYANPDNLDLGIYKAGDAYMLHLRGFELRASGPGNMTTDAFYFPGDGYLMFQPKGEGSGVYSVSIYEDATARIAQANVLTQFTGRLQPQMTRMRLPEGTYYLEINSTVAWEAFVVNTRGMAWLKRVMADEAKREEELKELQDAAAVPEN